VQYGDAVPPDPEHGASTSPHSCCVRVCRSEHRGRVSGDRHLSAESRTHHDSAETGQHERHSRRFFDEAWPGGTSNRMDRLSPVRRSVCRGPSACLQPGQCFRHTDTTNKRHCMTKLVESSFCSFFYNNAQIKSEDEVNISLYYLGYVEVQF
jgi:hypothetical protein